MNNTLAITVPTVADIKLNILPTLLLDPGAISQYGDSAIYSDTMERYSGLMKNNVVNGLSQILTQLVFALSQADPQVIEGKPTWLSRFTGKHLEKRVRYQAARQDVETLISQGQDYLKLVNETVIVLDELLEIYGLEIKRLHVFVQAGREYLDSSPHALTSGEDETPFENPRGRFARKVANLATLLTSNEMAAMQLKMTRALCTDMIDRFNETTTVLVPVWRQHTLSLLTVKNNNPSAIRKATQAHEKLLTSLNKLSEGPK